MSALKVRNPLEPLRSATGAVFTVALIGYAAAVLSTMLGRGNLFGLGESVVCVDANNLALPVGEPLAKPGVFANADGVSLCTRHADAGQHALGVLIGLPGPALLLGALFLLHRVIREAERSGVFGDRVAGRLRVLGWVLLVGQLATMVIKGSATAYFVADVSTLNPGTPWGITYWQWSWPSLLAGFGALTLARVIRIGARMREDLDGTV